MHETMIAHNVLTAICAEAEKHNSKPIAAKISCGTLNAINDEILCFAFGAIAKDSICENVKLKIEHKPIQGRCENCDRVFEFNFHQPKCPNCNSDKFKLLADAPLLLEEIEFAE